MRGSRGSLTLMLVIVLFTAIDTKHDAAADAWTSADWTEICGGLNNETANCVIQTSGGGYALAGYTYSLGAGGSDFWLIKTDSLGNVTGIKRTEELALMPPGLWFNQSKEDMLC